MAAAAAAATADAPTDKTMKKVSKREKFKQSLKIKINDFSNTV